LITLVIAEVIVRIINIPETAKLENHSIDGYTIRKPSLITNYKLNQYNNEIHFNEVGFRDDSWKINTEKIAVIGDSYMEALSIPEGEYFASILQQITNQDVINIAREKFNTYEEVYFFKKFAAHLKPKLVLLFMYMNNDISFNHEYKKKYKGKNIEPINYIEKNGIYTLPNRKLSSNILSSIKVHLINKSLILPKLYSSILKIKYGIPSKAEMPENGFASNFLDEIYIIDQYQSQKNIDNWKATEDALIEIKEIVNQYGGEFVLITFESRYNPKKSEFLDKDYPLQKISNIARGNELTHIPLNKFLEDYFSNIKEPKEGLHASDGHWNMLTHHIITYYILQQLNNKSIILLNDEVTNELNYLFNKNPVELIGLDEYHKIYGKD